MKTIQQIKKEQQDKLSKMFDDLGIFFAFSKEQLNEKKQDGITYVNGGYGMIIPKDNSQKWKERFDEYSKEGEIEYANHIPMEEYILYELNNHECFYTGDYSEALEAVQVYYPSCTIDSVRAVYQEEYKNADL